MELLGSIVTPSAEGAYESGPLAVLDERVVLRSDDAELIDAASALLAAMRCDGARTATLALTPVAADGAIVLSGLGPDRAFGSRAQLLEELPTALNQLAAASTSCLALHSGAVRSPAGEVVLLPATSGSGKTTLTAALVRLGWDYLTDEAVGVRAGTLTAVGYPKPLVLDASSREVLRLPPADGGNVAPAELRADVVTCTGDVGRVDRVILPRFERGARLHLELLAPQDAVIAVLAHALNLRRAGQPALAAACQLAERVPVLRLVHGDINEAVGAVTDSTTADA